MKSITKLNLMNALLFALFGYVIGGVAFGMNADGVVDFNTTVALLFAGLFQLLHFASIPYGVAGEFAPATKKGIEDQIGDLKKKCRDLIMLAEREKRDFSDDEDKNFRTYETEIDQLTTQLSKLEQAETRRKKYLETTAPVTTDLGTSEKREKRDMVKKLSFRKIMKSVDSNGRIDGVERELVDEARGEMTRAGIGFNSDSIQLPAFAFANVEQRDLTATGGSSGSEGGVNIATEIEGIIDVLLPEMVLGRLPIQKFTGLIGNLKFPQAGTAPSAGWNTEVGTATEKSPTFGSLTLSPKRLAAYVQLSNQLSMQSSNSIDRYIRNFLIQAQAIEFEKVCLKGGGSNEPTGIIGGTGYNAVYAGGAASNGTNANGAAPVWADIVNLVKTLKSANGNGQAYVTSPAVVGKLQVTSRQASGVEGNFIMPSWNGGTNGFPVLATTNLPDTFAKGASSALSAIIHGDFSKFAAASWAGVEIGKDTMTNMKEGMTNYVLASYVDCGMLVPTAFSVVKDVNAA